METVKETPEVKIKTFLEKFANSSADIISNGIGIHKLGVYKALKPLTESGEIIVTENEGVKTYALAVGGETSKKAVIKKATITNYEATLPKTEGRDTSKLKFNGELYGKGKVVLAVIQQYIKDNPRTTLAKLQEVFANLNPRYGAIQELAKAKKLSEGRDRFFMKAEQIMKIGDKKVAVCNQWGQHNIKDFIKLAKSLGYTIK